MANNDQTDQLEARIGQLEQRLQQPYGRAGAETAFWALMRTVFPGEARKHLKAAGREQLLAARAYIDLWVGKLDEGDAPGATAPRHENIEVE